MAVFAVENSIGFEQVAYRSKALEEIGSGSLRMWAVVQRYSAYVEGLLVTALMFSSMLSMVSSVDDKKGFWIWSPVF